MKRKLVTILIALTTMAWAQSATPNQTPAPEQKTAPATAKPACPCCDKMASADHSSMHKDMQACMHHDASAKADGKDAMQCCAGKDAKDAASCCGGRDMKACAKDDKSAACCAGGKTGEGHEMACCSAKPGDASSPGCCGGNSCGRHEHQEHSAPGN
jgi:hypothetical protein